MGVATYGVNLKPAMDVEARILDFETRTDMAAPMGLQREYTEAVKASNKANTPKR